MGIYQFATKLINSLFLIAIIIACVSCGNPKNSEETSYIEQSEKLRIWLRDQMKITNLQEGEVAFKIEHEVHQDTHSEYQLYFTSNSEQIPAHLLIPRNIEPPYPVMICLQGHAPGMFISLGKYNNDYEKRLVEGGRDFAIQSINNGWAALVVEQKGFGKRGMPKESGLKCNDLSLQELLRGNTMLGLRVYDVSRALDFVGLLDSLDSDKVGIMGHSAGGTTAYYTAAMDQRIKLSVVSCSFCTLEKSWLKYHHCACGYLPGLLEKADMPDIASLIAPRDLIIVAGKHDYIADIDGVKEGYETARSYYVKHQQKDNIKLLIGEKGHQFYPEKTWPEIQNVKASWN